MADDLKQTGKPDDARINVDQDHEVNYWSEKLGVSRDELRKAVKTGGPMVKEFKSSSAKRRTGIEGWSTRPSRSRISASSFHLMIG